MTQKELDARTLELLARTNELDEVQRALVLELLAAAVALVEVVEP